MSEQSNHMSVGNWFWTIFISGLPLIGLIMLFVWGFSSETDPSKKNWAKAMLLFQLIALIFVFFLFTLGVFGAMMNQ